MKRNIFFRWVLVVLFPVLLLLLSCGKMVDTPAILPDREVEGQFPESRYYSALLAYYVNEAALVDFCGSPNGSYEQAKTTVNDFKNPYICLEWNLRPSFQTKKEKKMKKVLCAVLLICMVLLCGCGKSEQAKTVDQMILFIGEVSEDSKNEIEKAEKAVEALSEKERASLDNLEILEKARADYDQILEEKQRKAEEEEQRKAEEEKQRKAEEEKQRKAEEEKQRKAEEEKRREAEEKQRQEDLGAAQVAIDAIDEIGELAYNSGELIGAARNAYDSLTEQQQAYVSNYDTLVYDEEHLSEVKISTAIDLIDKLGEVEYPDLEPLKPVQDVYRFLSEEERAQVTNFEKFQTQIDNYNRGYVKSLVSGCKLRCTKYGDSRIQIYFDFINENEKTVKYVRLGVRFKNAVGDVMKVNNHDYAVLEDIGPYAKGKGSSGNKECWTYYSWAVDVYNIASTELIYLEFEYTDGTKSTISENAIKFVYE